MDGVETAVVADGGSYGPGGVVPGVAVGVEETGSSVGTVVTCAVVEGGDVAVAPAPGRVATVLGARVRPFEGAWAAGCLDGEAGRSGSFDDGTDTPTMEATSLTATCMGDGSPPAAAIAEPEETTARAATAAARCRTFRAVPGRCFRPEVAFTWVVEMRSDIAATVGDPHPDS